MLFPPDSRTTRQKWSILNYGDSDSTADPSCVGVNAERSHGITSDGSGDPLIQRTLTDDIQRFYDDEIVKQLIHANRLYSFFNVTKGGLNSGPEIIRNNHSPNISGSFKIPPSSIIDGSFTKRYSWTTGADHHGEALQNLDYYSRTRHDQRFPYPQLNLSVAQTTFGSPITVYALLAQWTGEFPDQPHDEDTGLTVGQVMAMSPSQRPVCYLFNGRRKWAGLTFGEYVNNGLTLTVCEEINTVEQIQGNSEVWDVLWDYTVTSPAGDHPEAISKAYARCDVGSFQVSARNYTRINGIAPPSWDQSEPGFWSMSPVDMWWLEEWRQNFPASALAGFISRAAVEEKDAINDSATFRCTWVKGYRAGESLPYFEEYPENGSTIDDGKTLDIAAKVGDVYEVNFDNMGEHTTELTDVTFETPLVSSVDKTSETYTPFEYGKITFQGALTNGGNVCDPASSSSIDPSTLVLQSDSPDIVGAGSSLAMTYNGTTNQWTVSSGNITLNNYNGNTNYTTKVSVQALRSGQAVANLSHDISFDFGLTSTDTGTTVDDAITTIDSDVNNITPTGTNFGASIVDPSPYAPQFGDEIQWTWTFTGDSDSIDYVRVWKSSIDCTVSGGGGGFVSSDLVFTHDQSGNIIASPFTITLQSTGIS